MKKAVFYFETTEKWHYNYDICSEWLQYVEKGHTVREYLDRFEYKSVAVWNLNPLGDLLIDQINRENISLSFVIGNSKKIVDYGIPFISEDEEIPLVDVIIVPSFFYFENIRSILKEKTSSRIVCIRDIFRL